MRVQPSCVCFVCVGEELSVRQCCQPAKQWVLCLCVLVVGRWLGCQGSQLLCALSQCWLACLVLPCGVLCGVCGAGVAEQGELEPLFGAGECGCSLRVYVLCVCGGGAERQTVLPACQTVGIVFVCGVVLVGRWLGSQESQLLCALSQCWFVCLVMPCGVLCGV